jgi:tRNA(Ile)-lysidine synthetase-like protein
MPIGGGWTVRATSAAVAQHGPQHLLVASSAIERGASFRTWRPGDRLHLPTGGTQKLQDWFVDHHIPRYARRHLPLLAVGARVLWIVGVATFADTPLGDTEGVVGLTLLYNGAVWHDERGATRW